MADKTAYDILEEVTRQEYLIDPTAEQLRLRLNEIIDERHLNMITILGALARISAAYIHQIKKAAPDEANRQFVEYKFFEMVQAYIALHESTDTYEKQEQEKEERMKKN